MKYAYAVLIVNTFHNQERVVAQPANDEGRYIVSNPEDITVGVRAAMVRYEPADQFCRVITADEVQKMAAFIFAVSDCNPLHFKTTIQRWLDLFGKTTPEKREKLVRQFNATCTMISEMTQPDPYEEAQ